MPLEAGPEPSPLEARTFTRVISQSYQITSYSSLARSGQMAYTDADPTVASGMGDAPEQVASVRRTPSVGPVAADLLLEAFPGGVRTGTCVHEMLERCDFTRPEDWPRVVKGVIARHFPDGGDAVLQQRIDQVLELLNGLTRQARTGAGGHAVDLSQLSPVACIAEMEFYFPVKQVNLTALEAILQGWAAREGLVYAPAPYRSRGIDGFLTGSVDLFFTRGSVPSSSTGKPIAPCQSMRRCAAVMIAGMHAQMQHGRYYLQALIYTVATAAYLRHRQDFNWETHMGGFIYCFVRGLGRVPVTP